MNVAEVLLIVAGIAVAALAGKERIARRRRKAARRALMRVPEASIAAVKDGEMVRLKGRAVARAPLRMSPVSQRGCIGFHLMVDCMQSEDSPWERVVDKEEFDSFLLADGTGEAVLHAPFELKLDPCRETFLAAPSPALASVLEREGVPAGAVYVTGRRFRYAEIILLPGDEIIAVGRATIEIDPAGRSPSPRDPPVMCHLKGADEPVVIAEADELS